MVRSPTPPRPGRERQQGGAPRPRARRRQAGKVPVRVPKQHGDRTCDMQRLLSLRGMMAQERGLALQKRPRSVRQGSESSVAVPRDVLGKTLHKQTQICFHSHWFCCYITTVLQAIRGITAAFLAHYNFYAVCV